ncbi:MAG: hypothetical protein J0H38_17110 [Rhizobiales bacterium]|jgi:hypothetical protein|nr:hypothetical protein [Hyphomicrobiales bacterium]
MARYTENQKSTELADNHRQDRSQRARKTCGFIGRRLSLKRAWSAIASTVKSGYEPAQHYMRGPGPKTRARQAQAAETLSPES